MKRSYLDRFIGYLSPQAEANRIVGRMKVEMSQRAYDIAKSFPTSDWASSNKNNANTEVKLAIEPGRNKARSLEQNNPYGLKAVNVIVSETVGAGIVPNIIGTSDKQTEDLKNLWKIWGESKLCDFEAQQNFYGLQALALRACVVSGEGLGVERSAIVPGIEGKTSLASQIQLLESDFIATTKDEGKIVQGIQTDNTGKPVKYYLFKAHPGSKEATENTVSIDVASIAHIFKKERPGQLRGVTWFHSVAEKMKDLDDLQYATLVQKKIAACLVGVITTNGSDSALSAADKKAKREAEMSMQPASFYYADPGQDITFSSPPASNGYADFNREILRAIASGFGISYEALTSDYSQSTYSSSRMGHLQMRKNIEHWRWNILIPQFCEPAFSWFLKFAVSQGVVREDEVVKGLINVNWVPPAYSMIDPSKEVLSLQREIRSGLKSWKAAVIEYGQDPDQILSEVEEYNKKFDEKKLSFDTDPRRMSSIGFAQAGEALGLLSPGAPNLQKKEEVTNEEQPPKKSQEAPDDAGESGV